jgi:hypothetical protein
MTESDKSLTLRDAAELELMANAGALCLELELMRQMADTVVDCIELRKRLLKYRDAADYLGVPIRLSVLAALEESIVEGDAALARLDVMAESERVAMTEGDND